MCTICWWFYNFCNLAGVQSVTRPALAAVCYMRVTPSSSATLWHISILPLLTFAAAGVPVNCTSGEPALDAGRVPNAKVPSELAFVLLPAQADVTPGVSLPAAGVLLPQLAPMLKGAGDCTTAEEVTCPSGVKGGGEGRLEMLWRTAAPAEVLTGGLSA